MTATCLYQSTSPACVDLLGPRRARLAVGFAVGQQARHRSITPANSTAAMGQLVTAGVADLVLDPKARRPGQVDALHATPPTRFWLQEVRRARTAYRPPVHKSRGLSLHRTLATKAFPAHPLALPTDGLSGGMPMGSRWPRAAGAWQRNKNSRVARRAILRSLVEAMGVDDRTAAFVAVPLPFGIDAHLPAACHSSAARVVRQSVFRRRSCSSLARSAWRFRGIA